MKKTISLLVIFILLMTFVYSQEEEKPASGFEDAGIWESILNIFRPKPLSVFTVNCEPKSCTESDGGKNYEIYGYLTGYSINSCSWITRYDSCESDGRIKEYWCDGLVPMVTTTSCPSGMVCKNGACVQEVCDEYHYYCSDNNKIELLECGVQKSFSSCVSGTQCSGSITEQSEKSVSYVRDKLCKPISITCTDSDGTNYKNKGYVSFSGTILWDECSTLRPGYVSERYCEGNNAATTMKNCLDFGIVWNCEDGACVPEPQITCTDSDGLDYKNKGKITLNGNTIFDECSSTPNILLERFCSNNDAGTVKKNCLDFGTEWICKDGACIKEQPLLCTDSDSSIIGSIIGTEDVKTKGRLSINGNVVAEDQCENNDVLLERFCESKTMAGTGKFSCSSLNMLGSNYICEDGACVKLECKEEWVGDPFCGELDNRQVYRMKRQILAGQCRVEQTIFQTCRYESGYYCKDGECVPQGICESDDDCAAGYMCKDNNCVKQTCKTDNDCDKGFKCENGMCIEIPQDCERCGEGIFIFNICHVEECHSLGCFVSEQNIPIGESVIGIKRENCVKQISVGKLCDSTNMTASCITSYCKKEMSGTLEIPFYGVYKYVCSKKPDNICKYFLWTEQIPFVTGEIGCTVGIILALLLIGGLSYGGYYYYKNYK